MFGTELFWALDDDDDDEVDDQSGWRLGIVGNSGIAVLGSRNVPFLRVYEVQPYSPADLRSSTRA